MARLARLAPPHFFRPENFADVFTSQVEPSPRATGVLAVGVAEGWAKLSGAAQSLDRSIARRGCRPVLATGDFKVHLETALIYPEGVKAKACCSGSGKAITPQRVLAAARPTRAAEAGRRRRIAMALHTGATLDPATASAAAGAPCSGTTATPRTRKRREAAADRTVAGARRRDSRASPRTLSRAAGRGGDARARPRTRAGRDLVPEQLAERAVEIARTVGVGAGVGGRDAVTLWAWAACSRSDAAAYAPRFEIVLRPPTSKPRRGKCRRWS